MKQDTDTVQEWEPVEFDALAFSEPWDLEPWDDSPETWGFLDDWEPIEWEPIDWEPIEWAPV